MAYTFREVIWNNHACTTTPVGTTNTFLKAPYQRWCRCITQKRNKATIVVPIGTIFKCHWYTLSRRGTNLNINASTVYRIVHHTYVPLQRDILDLQLQVLKLNPSHTHRRQIWPQPGGVLSEGRSDGQGECWEASSRTFLKNICIE